jgi:hypothetical protein
VVVGSPDRPARSQTLYRPSYPAHTHYWSRLLYTHFIPVTCDSGICECCLCNHVSIIRGRIFPSLVSCNLTLQFSDAYGNKCALLVRHVAHILMSVHKTFCKLNCSLWCVILRAILRNTD